MIITLEDNALVADIKRALKLIRGVASVRMTYTIHTTSLPTTASSTTSTTTA